MYIPFTTPPPYLSLRLLPLSLLVDIHGATDLDEILQLLADRLQLLLDASHALEPDDVSRGRVLLARDRDDRVHRLREQTHTHFGRQARVQRYDLGGGEFAGRVSLSGGVGGAFEAVEEAADDGAAEGGRVVGGRVLRQERGGGDFVGEDVDFEVRLHDGHFDVERGDFVCQALGHRCQNRGRCGHLVDLVDWIDIHRRIPRAPSRTRSTCRALGCPNDPLDAPVSLLMDRCAKLKGSLMPVNTMMCPDDCLRIVGSTALMMLTGPKKLVSN